ncbi:MAG: GyrI-like domain-containing protein [Acidobacteria bacterium]|nr:GyrI-like domain-containing protein [Acidobacteriota bacterium]
MDGNVSMREIAAAQIASVRTTVSLPEIGPAHERAFMEIFSYLGRSGVVPAGPPMSIYHDPEFNEEAIDIEIGVPIAGTVAGEGRITSRRLDGGPAAVTLHAGPYEHVHRAYRALQAWMQARGHESAGPPREIYLAGPPQISDPAEYRTEVIWPIR